ncbi:MAG: hypothetical protein AAFX03_09170 [Pseudomonadota bacterium]
MTGLLLVAAAAAYLWPWTPDRPMTAMGGTPDAAACQAVREEISIAVAQINPQTPTAEIQDLIRRSAETCVNYQHSPNVRALCDYSEEACTWSTKQASPI